MTLLSTTQEDTLREMINIGVGRAAGLLNDMLNKHVTLVIPELSVLSYNELLHYLERYSQSSMAAVQVGFRGVLTGSASIVFSSAGASRIADLLTDADLSLLSEDMDELRIGVLSEVGNIVLNGVVGSMSNVLSLRLQYALPAYLEDDLLSMLGLKHVGQGNETSILIARANFSISEVDISGTIYIVFLDGSFGYLLEKIDTLGV